MLYKNVVLRSTAVLCGALILNGCGSSDSGTTGANTPTTTNTAAAVDTSAPDPTPTDEPQRSYTGAPVKPPAGFGNAQGRVLWNEKPAAGIQVSLCSSISFIDGCSGKTYTAKTDKDGNYTVDKVPPGDYSLAMQIFDTNMFLYPTSGIMTAAKFTIENGKTLDIRATNIYKTNLQIVSPKADETVKSGLPKLTWKPYAGAAEYEVNLSAPGNGVETQELKTASTSVVPTTPLLNGSYQWEVVARNANGTKIAATNSATPFKVTGQVGSSKVDLTSPRPDSIAAGTGLKFTWAKHPLATGYQFYLSSVKSGPVISFEDVQTTEYSLSKTLEAGKYYWSVTALKDGQKIAASDLVSFQVK